MMNDDNKPPAGLPDSLTAALEFPLSPGRSLLLSPSLARVDFALVDPNKLAGRVGFCCSVLANTNRPGLLRVRPFPPCMSQSPRTVLVSWGAMSISGRHHHTGGFTWPR